MALPIGDTPILSGEDLENFERKIIEGLKNTAHYIKTPKLAEARRLVKEIYDILEIDVTSRP